MVKNFITKKSLKKLILELNKEDLYSNIIKEEYHKNTNSDNTLDRQLLILNFRNYLKSKKLYILFFYTYLGFDYKLLSDKLNELDLEL